MRPYKIKIAPGEAYDINAVGDYIRIKSAGVTVTVEAPEQNESAELEQGDDVTLSAFSRLRLSHADAAEQSVTVYIGKGTRAGSSKIGGAVSVSNFPASTAVSNFPGSNSGFSQSQKTVTSGGGLLLSANAGRRFLMIQNKDGVGYIFISLNGAAATQADGFKIGPNASLILDVFTPNGAIYAIGDLASNANIIVAEGTL